MAEPHQLLLRPFLAGKDEVHVRLSTQCDRRPLKGHDKNLQSRWETALRENPRIFDASKFRLHRAEKDQQTGHVTLHLGLTSYKEYLGTNRADEHSRTILRDNGMREFADANAHLSNALGCEAVLVTSDSFVALLQRSCAVATHGGLFNGPSGHPEPSRARISHDAWTTLSEKEMLDASLRARDELFASVVQETEEEINVSAQDLGNPKLIGVMADSTGKPDMLFLLETKLDAAQVRDAYARGASEAWESDQLQLVKVESLSTCSLPLTAVTMAAVECFRAVHQLRCNGK